MMNDELSSSQTHSTLSTVFTAAEHLFVQVSALNSTIYVLDAAQPGLYPTVGQFSVAEIGSSGGAGLTIDCEGDLWALDQRTNIIYEIDSGETATHCSQDVLWLSETPISGTIAANQVIDITFDASVSNISQPGQYFAELKIDHDTPYALASVPVTMTVLASADMGRIEGIISSDRLGSSLSNAKFEIISNSVTIISGTSESDGSYQWWLTGGTYDVRISASDYFSDTQTVLVSAGVTTTHDVTLTLNAPFISITPASLVAKILSVSPFDPMVYCSLYRANLGVYGIR